MTCTHDDGLVWLACLQRMTLNMWLLCDSCPLKGRHWKLRCRALWRVLLFVE